MSARLLGSVECPEFMPRIDEQELDDAIVDTSAFVAFDVGSSNGTCFDGPLP